MLLAALSQDLYRVASGFHSGSLATAERFCDEALKRGAEIDSASEKPYIKSMLERLPAILSQKDRRQVSENALTYSILFQNYIVHSS